MKKSIYPIAVIILFIASAFVSFPTQEWKILEATSIKFESSHPSGVFKNFKGTIILDEKDLSNSKFDVTIDVASISTGNGMMNKKAQTDEWFNADKYPQIMYSTSKIEKSDDGVVLFGELKMKGKVKPTKINLKIDEILLIDLIDHSLGYISFPELVQTAYFSDISPIVDVCKI